MALLTTNNNLLLWQKKVSYRHMYIIAYMSKSPNDWTVSYHPRILGFVLLLDFKQF
jgi:hypothetical protein